eukprot:7261056-Alexandrium_andersonii.AAC.1
MNGLGACLRAQSALRALLRLLQPELDHRRVARGVGHRTSRRAVLERLRPAPSPCERRADRRRVEQVAHGRGAVGRLRHEGGNPDVARWRSYCRLRGS